MWVCSEWCNKNNVYHKTKEKNPSIESSSLTAHGNHTEYDYDSQTNDSYKLVLFSKSKHNTVSV